MQFVRRDDSRADWTAGNRSPATMLMIPMTTSISISVKPLCLLLASS